MLINNLKKPQNEIDVIKYILNKNIEQTVSDLENKIENIIIKQERIIPDSEKVEVIF